MRRGNTRLARFVHDASAPRPNPPPRPLPRTPASMPPSHPVPLGLELFRFESPIFRAIVEARPSRTVRSPYMADVRLLPPAPPAPPAPTAPPHPAPPAPPLLAHSPALGCCGLIAPAKVVLVSPAPDALPSIPPALRPGGGAARAADGGLGERGGAGAGAGKAVGRRPAPRKSAFTVECAVEDGVVVGTNALVGQRIAGAYLRARFPSLRWKTEVKMGESRWDFVGLFDEGEDAAGRPARRMVVEVKSVPLTGKNPNPYKKDTRPPPDVSCHGITISSSNINKLDTIFSSHLNLHHYFICKSELNPTEPMVGTHCDGSCRADRLSEQRGVARAVTQTKSAKTGGGADAERGRRRRRAFRVPKGHG